MGIISGVKSMKIAGFMETTVLYCVWTKSVNTLLFIRISVIHAYENLFLVFIRHRQEWRYEANTGPII